MDISFEQLGMAFSVRLLSQTKPNFDLKVSFELIKLDLSFIFSPHHGSTKYDKELTNRISSKEEMQLEGLGIYLEDDRCS